MAEINSARRGYVPDDARNFSAAGIDTMRKASRHIVFLINEGYDLKQATTFVGNHFLLSERQRLAVMRSLATNEQLKYRERKRRTGSELSGENVWIDGFNTIITLEVLLSDSILFTCMDGTIRDLAALRGTYRIISETESAVRMLFDVLTEMKIREGYPFDLDVQIQKDVDRTLYNKENVITSDSIILDHCSSWINLTEKCMERLNKQGIRVWEDRLSI